MLLKQRHDSRQVMRCPQLWFEECLAVKGLCYCSMPFYRISYKPGYSSSTFETNLHSCSSNLLKNLPPSGNMSLVISVLSLIMSILPGRITLSSVPALGLQSALVHWSWSHHFHSTKHTLSLHKSATSPRPEHRRRHSRRHCQTSSSLTEAFRRSQQWRRSSYIACGGKSDQCETAQDCRPSFGS